MNKEATKEQTPGMLALLSAQARRANAQRNLAAMIQVLGFAENRGFTALAEATRGAMETARAERDATEDEVDALLEAPVRG